MVILWNNRYPIYMTIIDPLGSPKILADLFSLLEHNDKYSIICFYILMVSTAQRISFSHTSLYSTFSWMNLMNHSSFSISANCVLVGHMLYFHLNLITTWTEVTAEYTLEIFFKYNLLTCCVKCHTLAKCHWHCQNHHCVVTTECY